MAKAISIKQPWAWAILTQGKDVENRKWKTKFRGTVFVHAGKTIDPLGVKFLTELGLDIPENLPTGCILGKMDIIDCKPIASMADNKWAFGPFCWLVANAEPFEEPIPQVGALSFFEVDI